jgi:hypothetical protein
MIRQLWFSFILCLCVTGASVACGPDWTYMGSGNENTRIHELADSAGVLLRVGDVHGIYRWTGQDTTWEMVGQFDRQLMNLYEYPELPHQLLGVDRVVRIYRSLDNGSTWDSVFTDGLCSMCHNYFTIDPANPTVWYAAGHEPTGCYVAKFTNSGANWDYLWICCGACPMVFAEDPESFYLTSYSSDGLVRCSLVDSTYEWVLNIAGENLIVSALKHPSQPWAYIFSGWDNATDVVVRYDVVTRDTTMAVLPDSSLAYVFESRIQFVEDVGLFVSTASQVFLLSEDLHQITDVTGNLPRGEYVNMLYASRDRMIVYVEGQGLFCRTLDLSAAPDHPQASKQTEVLYYPNPAREFLSFVPSGKPIGRVEIYNILGQRVQDWMGASSASPLSVSLSSLGSGTYFFRLYESPADVTPFQKNSFTIIK